MTTELKPCPFCSKIPSLKYFGDYVVFCTCGGGMNKQFHEAADAIASWNSRTPVEQLSTQTAEPYGYVLKTGHGAAFRENLAGVEPDFVKHWVRVCTHPAKTEQLSLSDAEILAFVTNGHWRDGDGLLTFSSADLIERVRALLSAQRQDSDKDAERYRKAIAYEDNAGLLYCAVMNHCPDKAAIDAEFDAEAIDVGL